MQFQALIEEWPGESMIFFRELPGCFSAASTSEKALQAAPATIETYFHWLKENGIVLVEEDGDPISVTPMERLESIGSEGGPLFVADHAAPSDLEIDNALNVAATARALIIELVTNVPSHLHDQTLAPSEWSLTRHLQHIMESETWYVSRLTEDPAPEQPTADLSADDISLKIFEHAMDYEVLLRDLTTDQRSRVFLHDGEQWTAAKVLRRMAGHLHEHYQSMDEMVHAFSATR
jgi:predicted RNase H-like HicB family nuclease/uncharacterized damage-inducible protein DinB